MTKIFISGITGTLGSQVAKSLLSNPDIQVVGFSRDEQKQMQIDPHPRLTLYLGDIRDRRRVVEATRGCELIFHFAALKCVDILEANPEEAIATNVYGTENILNAQRSNNIPRVVFSSTDKAVYPINAYGYSKAIAEKLVIRNPNNVVVRYGNVLASRGSVIPMFIKTILEENSVNITDENMTRFFLRLQDAASFVIRVAAAKQGGIYIYQDMKSVKIVDLAHCVADILGKKSIAYKITGLRPGEKIHECLQGAHEGKILSSDTGARFSKQELTSLIRPIVLSLTSNTKKQTSLKLVK